MNSAPTHCTKPQFDVPGSQSRSIVRQDTVSLHFWKSKLPFSLPNIKFSSWVLMNGITNKKMNIFDYRSSNSLN